MMMTYSYNPTDNTRTFGKTFSALFRPFLLNPQPSAQVIFLFSSKDLVGLSTEVFLIIVDVTLLVNVALVLPAGEQVFSQRHDLSLDVLPRG